MNGMSRRRTRSITDDVAEPQLQVEDPESDSRDLTGAGTIKSTL